MQICVSQKILSHDCNFIFLGFQISCLTEKIVPVFRLNSLNEYDISILRTATRHILYITKATKICNLENKATSGKHRRSKDGGHQIIELSRDQGHQQKTSPIINT